MISGKLWRDAIISAANNIANSRKLVDSLNVFPVPDGDTGTNMSMTIGAAKRELQLVEDSVSISEASRITASALLRGARGNSGVILSLLFRGMSNGFKGQEEATPANIIDALEKGVEAAYKAVMKPTEGTILTVARLSAEHCKNVVEENPEITSAELWEELLLSSKDALDQTPEMLPVLKKAGVVDAGGKGLLLIYEGMGSVISGKGIVPDQEHEEVPTVETYEHDAAAEFEGEITFGYCTEFIVLKDPKVASAISLRAYLESIGDSVVVVEDEEIIKVHVHTDNPGNAIQKGLENGQLTNLKIDNMRQQHAAKKRTKKAKQVQTKKFEYKPVDKDIKYGFVAVCAGEGIEMLFKDLSVDNIVSGGQTMNPSTDDILEAIQATPAETVIVLPNNKNIIMAAEQAEILADRKVYVLPTNSIPQGLSAMLVFDPDASLEDNQMNMVEAIDNVSTGLLTFAARDSDVDGHKIKKGEYLALENGKLAFSDKDLTRSLVNLTRALVDRDSSYVTLLYGEDITDEQSEELEAAVSAKLPSGVEVISIKGDQPVYYYIVSVE